ncbi:hypothetical protein K2173_020716 [Erythroxylum novogranatense]|uniref:Reverse transcriptase domain-containing protein n=1 Tax=Erythroxylum novogranatense TaxID=1862640 RepID=A0AAV8TMW1_9ROSI|nr:hypothetical protein K2173_020716 [Erythroxylum novogranatense]
MATNTEEDRLVQEMYQRLNLEEEERVLEYAAAPATGEQNQPNKIWQHCVVGRLLTEKSINFMVFKQVMASVWRPVKGLLVKELGNNVFVFQFFHHLDVERVLNDGPWNYQQNPLLLHVLQPHENPRQIELVKLVLWVQLHNVPHGFVSEKVAGDVGKYIGEFIESDPRNYSPIWRDFMRIRVAIDIRKPLKRKMLIKWTGGENVCLEFKYERLNTFCYFCGIVGHTDKFCRLLYDYPNFPKEKFAYGTWLKANYRRQTQVGSKWLRSENDLMPEMENGVTGLPSRNVQQQATTTDFGNPVDGAGVMDSKRRRLRESIEDIQEQTNMEVDLVNNTLLRIKSALNFSGLFYVDHSSTSGGLILMWKEPNMARLLSYSNHHIDIEVIIEGMKRWRLTGFYGFPERQNRSQGWDLLRHLSSKSTLLWCVIGDFNDIMFLSEKQGNNSHPRSLLEGFRTAISDCHLHDLGFEGPRFTWENCREGDALVRERLDRSMGTLSWSSMFPLATISVLQSASSDHLPIFLSLGVTIKRYVQKRFRFESEWAIEDECKQLVSKGWTEGTLSSLQDRLKCCSQYLQDWAQSHQRVFYNSLREVKHRLAFLRRQPILDMGLLRTAEKQYGELLLKNEVYWKQRSKQHWLAEGDSNSRFFHMMASHRRRKNLISRLQNNNGEWVDWNSGLPELIVNYYRDLFTPSHGDPGPLLQYVESKVTPSQNALLLAPFTGEDIRHALFSMHPQKSPGPDGFNPGFFQTFWDIVGPEVTTECLKCLNGNTPMPGQNRTNVVLIPKKKTPETMTDLRPISLSNVTDRVVCKAMTNRLKLILPQVITDTQSAFIPNRLITNNIIVAYELFHTLKRKTQGRLGFLALKTDMSKAYDRIEWPYLRLIMLKLGFNELWVTRIMRIVTSVSYYFIHGSDEHDPLIPGRGLRQGDPLSPYLFILCAEGLSAILSKYQAQGRIHGALVARGAIPVSHLFFADDVLFFTRATREEALQLKECLHFYETASGQKINLSKFGVSFTPNTEATIRSSVCQILGVNEHDGHNSYLGMPSVIGRNKRQVFQYVVEKLTKRLQGWKAKLLSKTGKDVLLRTVAQAMPNYIMSLFQLPIDICKDLETLMNSFFWQNGDRDNIGIKWLRWRRLAIPKIHGGLGYRDLRQFNLALLAKQGWKLIKYPNSFAAKIMKARYFPNSEFFTAPLGNNPSQIWRSICQARPILMQGCRRRVGDGATINIWQDSWLMDDREPTIQTEYLEDRNLNMVADLMIGRQWNEPLIRDSFSSRDATAILIWRLLCNILPCRTTLRGRHMLLDDTCPICLKETKRRYMFLQLVGWHTISSLQEWLKNVVTSFSQTQAGGDFMIIWSLSPPSYILSRARTILSEWKAAKTSTAIHAIRTPRPPVHWVAPTPNHFKCNVDVALLEDGDYGLGMVIRNSQGRNCAGKLLKLPGWRDPQIGETLCFREALSWIKSLSFFPICVETDCLIVSQFLESTHIFSSYFSVIIQDCKALLHELSSVSFAFVRKPANQVAHTIARAANSMSSFEWGVCPPSFLYDALTLDFNNMR